MQDTLQHTNIEALKRRMPIAEVVARYGIELRPTGRAMVGWCPFHQDRHKPNLHVYPDTDSYYCYRCGIGGDAIDFVERIDRVDFRGAISRLTGLEPLTGPPASVPRRSATSTSPPASVEQRKRSSRGTAEPARRADEQACLDAATELYHNRLLTDTTARAYVRDRAIDRDTLTACRVGYAAGGELVEFLRWRRLPLAAAQRAGLVGPSSREFLAGRVVVPEIRDGLTVWLVGRTIAPEARGPKYLGLPGRKPLMGWAAARRSRWVVVTEGVFDWLALRAWSVPALSLVGTHASPDVLDALTRFERVYLALDGDGAGREATAALVARLPSALPLELPLGNGIKDVADLARLPEGRSVFRRALEAARPNPALTRRAA